tara:strand:- start:41314 stop:41697 length:384 start_codon:yes stop_codon:yes gene_type:complete
MAGVTPNEGKDVILNNVYVLSGVLQIGLITNVSGLSEASVLANISEPTGGGYARQNLTNASWVILDGNAAHPDMTFTAVGGDYVGDVYGYFITANAGATLLHFEVDANAPISILDAQSYIVDLSSVI